MQPLSASVRRSLERAAATYESQLDSSAWGYLESRGLGAGTSLATVTSHRLGVVRSPIKGDERFVGRLCIPYLGPSGNVYGMNFRCIEDHDCKEIEGHRKYDKPSGLESRMFNTRALTAPTDYLFVTEGELDAITITACGWPAVALPGANSWKAHYGRMLDGFSRVVLLADDDDAGRKLGAAFMRAVPSAGSVIVSAYGEARDVNEVYVRYGKAGLQSLLSERDEDE